MAESLVHLRLVDSLIAYIEREYAPSHQLAVFHDMPGPIGGEKPPRIGGYVPDLYAIDAPLSITILGEAKTEADLETDHSRRQLVAFLEFLGVQRCGVLVLAVPWQASATAKNLICRLQRELQCSGVRTVVITTG